MAPYCPHNPCGAASCYDCYSTPDDQIRNNHHFPTGGRPLGTVHRAAQAEKMDLSHIPGGCYSGGRCEQHQREILYEELRQRGVSAREGWNTRQLLRLSHGLPHGAADRTPTGNPNEHAAEQQTQVQGMQARIEQLEKSLQQAQLGPAPAAAPAQPGPMAGPSGGRRGGVPLSIQGDGGGYPMGMDDHGMGMMGGGGGGFRGDPYAGMMPRGGGGGRARQHSPYSSQGSYY
ncbi:MAG: hypothetical protein Q9169_004459 [Polycauliona sp. 2 TL-2023]